MTYSPRRVANKGVKQEARVASALGAKHVGGPGRHDFEFEDGRRGENKHWAKRRVHAGVIRDAHDKGISIVNASGRKGFSKKAKRLAKELGVEVRHHKPHQRQRSLGERAKAFFLG